MSGQGFYASHINIDGWTIANFGDSLIKLDLAGMSRLEKEWVMETFTEYVFRIFA